MSNRDWKPINRIEPGELLEFAYRDIKGNKREVQCIVDSIGIHDVHNLGEPSVCINGIDLGTGRREPYVLSGIDLYSVEVYRQIATRVEWRSEDGTVCRVEETSYPGQEKKHMNGEEE